MNDLTGHSERDHALEGMAYRYEALVRDLGILREMEGLDSGHLGPEDVGACFVGAVARENGAEHCSIMLLDPGTGQLVLRAVGTRFAPHGYAVSEEAWHGKSFALGEGVAGHVAETRRHVRIDDTCNDSRFLSIPDSPVAVNALLCFPLIAHDRLLGVLNLSHSQSGFFTADREHSTWLLARRVSLLIDEAQRKPQEKSPEKNPEVSNRPSETIFLAERMHALAGVSGGAAKILEGRLTRLVNTLDNVLHQVSSAPIQDLIVEARRDGIACAEAVATLNRFASLTHSPRLRSPIAIEALFQEVCTTLGANKACFLTPTIDVDTGLLPLHGDATQLHQMFVALGMNALAALDARREGSYLRFAAERVRRELKSPETFVSRGPHEYIRAYVSDNGAGMDSALAERCLEPFYRGVEGGIGLGLTTAYYVARQHNGWLEIDSVPGHGTTVSVFFPLATYESQVPEPKVGQDSGPCVMLVDDEPLIRNLGKALLKRIGFQCILAEDGVKAMEKFACEASTIDVVIIDLNMPGMNGLELLEKLRAQRPELPAIISSGDTEDLDRPELQSTAKTSYLKKPYLVATLEEVLRATLG